MQSTALDGAVFCRGGAIPMQYSEGKVYSKEEYSDHQLEQIKLAIEEGLNPNNIVSPNIQLADLVTWRQDERDKKTYSSKA